MPAPVSDKSLDLLACVPASIPSTQELAEGDEEFLSLAEACPAVGEAGVNKAARKKLPRCLEEGGEFVSVTIFRVKRGQGDQVVEQMKKVHEETDERELSVYSHRVLRGIGPDEEDQICIIMEFDNPQAFHRHFMNNALQDLINSPIYKTNKPKMSFFQELDS